MLVGTQSIVSRAGHDYITTDYWGWELSDGGHCIGHALSGEARLRVHDLELDTNVDIVDEGWLRLHWLALSNG